MIQSRLNDAAIALSKALTEANIKHGIFGGYAVTVLGGPRETKDVDCLASASKDQIVTLLNAREDFTFIPQSRQDYAAFLWSAKPADRKNVLVELFVDTFEGKIPASVTRMSLTVVQYLGSEVPATSFIPLVKSIQGETLGNGNAFFLDPVYIFKGKLRACATREKPHDAADLRWLEDRFGADLQRKIGEINLEWAGLALKRSPELEYPLSRIGLDIEEAKARVAKFDINNLPSPQPGDVQKGLLALP